METHDQMFDFMVSVGIFHGIVTRRSSADPRVVLLKSPQHLRGEFEKTMQWREALLRNLHAFAREHHDLMVACMGSGDKPEEGGSMGGEMQLVTHFIRTAGDDPEWLLRFDAYVTEKNRDAFGLSLRTVIGFAALDAYWASPYAGASP